MDRLGFLRRELSEQEWRDLMALAPEGGLPPFDRPAELDLLIATADDGALELLIKCQALLEAEFPEDAAPERQDTTLVFAFEPASRELEHFLGSLRRNGFTAATLEGAKAIVYVYLDGVTDQEFFHLKETVRSLYEFTRTALGRNLKGRRLHTS